MIRNYLRKHIFCTFISLVFIVKNHFLKLDSFILKACTAKGEAGSGAGAVHSLFSLFGLLGYHSPEGKMGVRSHIQPSAHPEQGNGAWADKSKIKPQLASL